MTTDEILDELNRRLAAERLRRGNLMPLPPALGHFHDGRVEAIRDLIIDVRWKIRQESQQCNKSES